MNARIACAGISGRIIQGRVNKAGDSFTGQTRDVTSDVLKAVLDKLRHHGGSFDVTSDGKVVATITLVEQGRDTAALTAALREAVEYLDISPMESIGSGSILHQRMRAALSDPSAHGGDDAL